MEKKAPELLRDWLKEEGRKMNWLASKLNTSPPTVSTWLTGKHKPTTVFQVGIEKITDGHVALSDW